MDRVTYVQSGRPDTHFRPVGMASTMPYVLYNFAFGFSCLSIASATIRRWILPVAVFGMLSVK